MLLNGGAAIAHAATMIGLVPPDVARQGRPPVVVDEITVDHVVALVIDMKRDWRVVF